LIPPLRRMKAASGSELGLYSIAYRTCAPLIVRK
jgi:hypothetical protein